MAAAPLSERAKFNLLMAIVALTALMVVTTSLTADTPHLVEDDVETRPIEDYQRGALEREVVLEGIADDTSISTIQQFQSRRLAQPIATSASTARSSQSELDVLDAALTAAQQRLAGGEGEETEEEPGVDASSQSDAVAAEDPPPGDGAAAAGEAAPEQGSTVSGAPSSPKVQQALKDAANAKIQAMAAQQKALVAGEKAKAAAAEAAQAPMTQAGQEVVRRAQRKLAEAKIDVDAAKAAATNLEKLKAQASKVIIEAAGGDNSAATGYEGQGGYFGAALRTAYKNGQLSERLKNEQWKSETLTKAKHDAYVAGEKKGEEIGEKEGEKLGAEKELPKAVAKAEQMLSEEKQARDSAAHEGEKAVQDAALKDAAAKEADAVREKIESEASGAPQPEVEPIKSDEEIEEAASDAIAQVELEKEKAKY